MTHSLVVPINVDVLVVNQGVVKRDGALRWWDFNYKSLDNFQSPEPFAGDRDINASKPGTYLHWSLPRSLREGIQGKRKPGIHYPLVPNRWLVIRMSGEASRTATAWVVESDCPYSPVIKTKFNIEVGQSSQYLVGPDIIDAWKNSPDDFRSNTTLSATAITPQVANIGIAFPQSKWSERDPNSTFLTAMAPGNDAFSAYYPHNVGVFSMYDSLDGIDTATLSYMVVGWYSKASDDVLAQGQGSADDYAALLKQLDWTPGPGVTGQNATSLYEGMALDIDWDRNGSPPDPDPMQTIRTTKNVNVSIGNSDIDAFTALVKQQLQANGHPTQTVKLLEAFNFSLLQLINDVNGDALLMEKIRDNWFGSEPGGNGWIIVANDGDGSAQTTLTSTEAEWLVQLNRDQTELNQALNDLFAMQWDLVATWYKKELDPSNYFPEPPEGAPSTDDLAKALDPGNANGITAKVVGQFETVNDLLRKVPQPDWTDTTNAQQALQAGIASFAKSKGLNLARMTLKAVPNDRYYEATNPVVMISGVESAHDTNPSKALTVRNTATLVTAMKVTGKTIDAGMIESVIPKLPGASNLPAAIPSIMTEFFLLDPANAGTINTAAALGDEDAVKKVMSSHTQADYVGSLPSFKLDPWSQPWEPLFMEWKLNYTHIPYQDSAGTRKYWTFDGTAYRYTPDGAAPPTTQREVSGISKLVPSAQFVFSSRLREYLAKYKNQDLSDLESWIKQIDDWKFLSQELTGFHDLLSMRDPRSFRRPTEHDTVGAAPAYSVADLAGFPTASRPGATTLPSDLQGNVGSLPYLPNGPVYDFHGVRSAQASFEYLRLYDKFGRVLWFIEQGSSAGLYDAANFPLVRDPALVTKDADRIDDTIHSVIQLPPRILQHARLDFDLVDATDETRKYGRSIGANPIGGWVLPNHLDHSILVYAPDGESLGEFRLFAQADGSKAGSWTPPPHSSGMTLADVATKAPLIHGMITAPELTDEAAFDAFLNCIDSTLWTIDPLGNRDDQNLSVLIGRPLALVRAQLALTLHGRPRRASDWAHTTLNFSNVSDPEFVDFEFGIRLGDQATRRDGVIGYFADSKKKNDGKTDYGRFNSVVAPETETHQDYISPIGPLGATTEPNFIRLPFKSGRSAFVSILVDPRASMHAVTGLLPIKKVDVPAGLVEVALSRIQVGFAMGPILTDIQPTPTQGDTKPAFANAVTLPSPIEQNGAWSWWERNAKQTGWNGYNLVNAMPIARLGDLPNTLREGILQLSIDLNSPVSDDDTRPD